MNNKREFSKQRKMFNNGNIKTVNDVPPQSNSVQVMIASFPLQSDPNEVYNYLRSFLHYNRIDLKTDNNGHFKGYIFVYFDNYNLAKAFTYKKSYYNKKLLDVRIIIDSNQHITDCLNFAREPKQIFVTNLPSYYDKRDVSVLFDQFGKTTEITIMNNKEKRANICIVTFVKTSSCKKAIVTGKIKIDGHGVIFINYAQPKFSKYMLVKIHPTLRRYIKQISRGVKNYDPEEFLKLQDQVLADNESLQCLEKLEDMPKKGKKRIEFGKKTNPKEKNFIQYEGYPREVDDHEAPAGTNNLQETTDFNYIYQENESDLNAILSQPKDYNHQVIIGGNSDKGHVDSTSIQKNHFIRKDHLKKEFRGECESIDLKKRDANLKLKKSEGYSTCSDKSNEFCEDFAKKLNQHEAGYENNYKGTDCNNFEKHFDNYNSDSVKFNFENGTNISSTENYKNPQQFSTKQPLVDESSQKKISDLNGYSKEFEMDVQYQNLCTYNNGQNGQNYQYEDYYQYYDNQQYHNQNVQNNITDNNSHKNQTYGEKQDSVHFQNVNRECDKPNYQTNELYQDNDYQNSYYGSEYMNYADNTVDHTGESKDSNNLYYPNNDKAYDFYSNNYYAAYNQNWDYCEQTDCDSSLAQNDYAKYEDYNQKSYLTNDSGLNYGVYNQAYDQVNTKANPNDYQIYDAYDLNAKNSRDSGNKNYDCKLQSQQSRNFYADIENLVNDDYGVDHEKLKNQLNGDFNSYATELTSTADSITQKKVIDNANKEVQIGGTKLMANKIYYGSELSEVNAKAFQQGKC